MSKGLFMVNSLELQILQDVAQQIRDSSNTSYLMLLQHFSSRLLPKKCVWAGDCVEGGVDKRLGWKREEALLPNIVQTYYKKRVGNVSIDLNGRQL